MSHMLLQYGVEILHHNEADIAGTVQGHNETVRMMDEEIKRQNKKNGKEAASRGPAAVCNSERRVRRVK